MAMATPNPAVPHAAANLAQVTTIEPAEIAPGIRGPLLSR